MKKGSAEFHAVNVDKNVFPDLTFEGVFYIYPGDEHLLQLLSKLYYFSRNVIEASCLNTKLLSFFPGTDPC